MTIEIRIIEGKPTRVQTKHCKIVKILGPAKKIVIHEEDILKHEEELKYGYTIRNRTYKNQGEYRYALLKNKFGEDFILLNKNEQLDSFAKQKGYKSYKELLDTFAISRGFIHYEEYTKVWRYYPDMINPLYIDRSSLGFIGHIAELFITKIIENIDIMQPCYPGYDFIYRNKYKIDVKGAILNRYNTFHFHIRNNDVTDYFILVAFDNNIINLNPLYVWLIKCDENITEDPINRLDKLVILNDNDKYSRCIMSETLKKYEMPEILNKLKILCIDYNKKEEEQFCNKEDIFDAMRNAIYIRKETLSTILESDFGLTRGLREELLIPPEELHKRY